MGPQFNDPHKFFAEHLIGLMEEHEKMAWMLRSFLEVKCTGRSR